MVGLRGAGWAVAHRPLRRAVCLASLVRLSLGIIDIMSEKANDSDSAQVRLSVSVLSRVLFNREWPSLSLVSILFASCAFLALDARISPFILGNIIVYSIGYLLHAAINGNTPSGARKSRLKEESREPSPKAPQQLSAIPPLQCLRYSVYAPTFDQHPRRHSEKTPQLGTGTCAPSKRTIDWELEPLPPQFSPRRHFSPLSPIATPISLLSLSLPQHALLTPSLIVFFRPLLSRSLDVALVAKSASLLVGRKPKMTNGLTS